MTERRYRSGPLGGRLDGVPLPIDDYNAQILQVLRGLGASDAQVEAAVASGRPAALAVDLVLGRDFAYTLDEVAARFGVPSDYIVELYRLLGVTLDPEGRVLGEADVELLDALSVAGAHRLGTGDEANMSQDAGENLLRVIGSSVSRIADAAVSTFVQDVEVQLQGSQADVTAWVRAEVQIGEVAHKVAPGLGTLFIHHLIDAIRRQRVTQEGVSERSMARIAVGFVDLVGFTPLSRNLSPQDLVKLVTHFEQSAFDIASQHDGRVIKHIGDEVMWMALTPDDGAEIALALIDEFAGDVQPRGAVCFGEALTLRGDYYGPVVNLAARLVDEAVPGEVLIDLGSAQQLQRVESEAAGRRVLKGFDEPVAVCSLIAPR
jgi:adenylate cyclase